MDKDTCDERLASCTKRMDSHAIDISKIFDTFKSHVTWRVFKWTLTILFAFTAATFTYAKSIDNEVSKLVTQKDMEQYQKKIIDAINRVQ